MSHINYSSDTSESDFNEISLSLFDSNEEQEISYDEMNESKGEKIFSPEQNVENTQFLKNTQTTIIKQKSLSPLPLSSTITMTESPSPPLSTLSLRQQLSSPNQLNTHSEMNRKCLTTIKNDRRMAKQMTERKRRDRINALLDNLRTLILKLLHKNPRHHRKLEKADILELVVSFLKKELNHNRLKPTKTSTTSNSSQQICKPMLSVQNIDSSLPTTPLIYTNNHYCQNHLPCIPQSNQSTNYYQDFTKYNIGSTKINYPIYDCYIQQNTNTYPLTIPSYYSSYKQPSLQQPLQLSQDSKSINLSTNYLSVS
ncbi:Protein hairy [Schistosoma japonicum]|uniref:Protein hairy n=1 Tax=Schistosoma japonicum TaxID=6182 RepID=A0A4Z2DE73_SCHJA|nr:Protein hairy [Schistosoma japonicum]